MKRAMVQKKAVATVLMLVAGMGLMALSAAWSARAASERPGASSRFLDELRKSFTIDGKPVPPEVFRDLGDGDMADSGSIRVTIDAKAAIGSNLYFDPIKRAGEWIVQTKAASKDDGSAEETAYRFVGSTRNKLLVAVASYNSGGSGVFYTLQILDGEMGQGFDAEGKRYDRVNVTEIRSIPLGDRWNGTVSIAGDAVTVTTTGSIPPGPNQKSASRVIQAERP